MIRKLLLTLVFTLSCMSASLAYVQDEDSLYAQNLLKPGIDAPEIELCDTAGSVRRLSDQWMNGNEGSFTILEFFAGWCPDCRKVTPGLLKELRDKSIKNLSVYGVSFDTDSLSWKRYLRKLGPAGVQVSPLRKWKTTKVSADYHVDWIPTFYVIDPEGKILLATVRADRVSKCINDLIEEGKLVINSK